MEEPDEGEALVSFGIATAVRDAAISVGTVLGLLYLFPVLRRVISTPGWRPLQGRTQPIATGLRPPAGIRLSAVSISPSAGLGVLAVCAATALLVGCLLLRLRDA
jgi:ABC-2 type transport system permease protein